MTSTGKARPALVWDMGGVMYRYFTEVVLDVGHDRGWPVDRIPLGPTGTVHDAAYAAQMRGDIDESQYLASVRADLDAVDIDFDPTSEIHWPDQERRATWEVIRTAHEAGHPQALLTNDASKWLGDGWWETWEPARWFDHLIDVEQVGVRKPAPEPYLAAARALALPPEECLFIDDLTVNCAGAEAVGMTSHHVPVQDPVGAMRRLAARLGLTVEV